MPNVKSSLVVWLAVATLLASCPARSRAQAPAPPDSTRLTLLRFAVQNFDDIRVTTGGRGFVVRDPVVASRGVMLTSRVGGDSRITSEARTDSRTIPWAEIESIEVRRGGRGAPVLVGALVGVAIGGAFVVAEAFPLALSGRESDGTPVLVGLAGGATLGALLGAPGRWRHVYP